MSIIDRPDATAVENGIVAVSLELSRSKWLVTSLLPGSEKMSKHTVAAGDAAELLGLLGRRRRRAEEHLGGAVRVVAIAEAGLDGFWLHRLLEANGIESHVVDAASVAVPRRRRRGKSDGIDGETLLRTLAGVAARRAAGVLDGEAAEPAGGRPPPRGARAGGADPRAHRDHQPYRRPADEPGRHRLSTVAARSPPAPGNAGNRRRPRLAAADEA
jgi:hypothetical protein